MSTLLFECCNSVLDYYLDPEIASFSYVQTASLWGLLTILPFTHGAVIMIYLNELSAKYRFLKQGDTVV